MRIIKTTSVMALALGLMLAGIHSAAAQGFKGKTHGGVCISVAKALDLTEHQKELAKDIFQASREQAKAVWSDESLTREQKRPLLREIMQSAFAEFRQILTPAQLQKLDEMKGSIRKHHRAKRGGLGANLMRAARYLELTPEQQSAIRGILEARREQVKALRADTMLTQEQKRAAYREIAFATRAEILSLLTPEQQQKFNRLASRARTHITKRLK